MSSGAKRFVIPGLVAITVVALIMGSAMVFNPSIRDPSLSTSTVQPSTQPISRDWFYGNPAARWMITEYADLECPYCRSYTPELKQWVSQQPDVKLKWHHFPLQAHGFAALREARLAQCAGNIAGAEAFWQTIDQVFLKSRGDGQGLAVAIELPTVSADALDRCADSNREVAAEVLQQRDDARSRGIAATPTLEVTDTLYGRTVRMEGPVDGVALLSIIDGLAAQPTPVNGEQ